MASLMAERRQTEIAKMANPATRLVTYSKRRKVVVFSPADKPCSFGNPSAERAEWIETEWATCAIEEDLEPLILKYEAVRDCVREKLKALGNDSQVEVGAGDSHKLSDEEIDSIFESLKGQIPTLAALLTEGDGFLTSPENPATGDGSLASGAHSRTL
ncbi:hypothetical protein NL676_023418 [Syzygium grande]|nr:hypothetical protein NL676_023418 [Syzygium grande]